MQVYFIGLLFATQFWGYVADRYGRRRVRSATQTLDTCGTYCVIHVRIIYFSAILVLVATYLWYTLQALYLGNTLLAVFGSLTALAPYYGWILVLRALTAFASGVAIVQWVVIWDHTTRVTMQTMLYFVLLMMLHSRKWDTFCKINIESSTTIVNSVVVCTLVKYTVTCSWCGCHEFACRCVSFKYWLLC